MLVQTVVMTGGLSEYGRFPVLLSLFRGKQEGLECGHWQSVLSEDMCRWKFFFDLYEKAETNFTREFEPLP